MWYKSQRKTNITHLITGRMSWEDSKGLDINSMWSSLPLMWKNIKKKNGEILVECDGEKKELFDCNVPDPWDKDKGDKIETNLSLITTDIDKLILS